MTTNPSEPSQAIQPSGQRTSIYAIVSMVTGIATYVFVPFHNLFHMKLLLAAILAPISAIIAIDTGHRAHHEILAGQGTVTGQKMSRTGQILGYVYFGLIILLIVLAIVLFKDLASGISNLVSSLGL